MKKIFIEIIDERLRQDEKWGQQDIPCLDEVLLKRKGGCTTQVMTEIYEIPTENRAKQICDINFKRGSGTFAHIAIEEMCEVVSAFDIHERRKELIQLAAVCVAWLEKIDRDIEKIQNDSN